MRAPRSSVRAGGGKARERAGRVAPHQNSATVRWPARGGGAMRARYIGIERRRSACGPRARVSARRCGNQPQAVQTFRCPPLSAWDGAGRRRRRSTPLCAVRHEALASCGTPGSRMHFCRAIDNPLEKRPLSGTKNSTRCRARRTCAAVRRGQVDPANGVADGIEVGEQRHAGRKAHARGIGQRIAESRGMCGRNQSTSRGEPAPRETTARLHAVYRPPPVQPDSASA